jgi:hypothetical protein
MEALLEMHLHDYSLRVKRTTSKIADIWGELELQESERQDELQKAFREVDSVWESALMEGHQRKLKIASQMEVLQREITDTQEQLGNSHNVYTHLQVWNNLSSCEERAHKLHATFNMTC